MGYIKRSYIEHVAFYVKDMQWYIDFFEKALGMKIVNVVGDTDDPSQVWLQGGLQLISHPNFDEPEGRMGHIAIMTNDLEQTLEEVHSWEVTELSKGRNWVELPDGLVLELIQAPKDSLSKLFQVEVSYE